MASYPTIQLGRESFAEPGSNSWFVRSGGPLLPTSDYGPAALGVPSESSRENSHMASAIGPVGAPPLTRAIQGLAREQAFPHHLEHALGLSRPHPVGLDALVAFCRLWAFVPGLLQAACSQWCFEPGWFVGSGKSSQSDKPTIKDGYSSLSDVSLGQFSHSVRYGLLVHECSSQRGTWPQHHRRADFRMEGSWLLRCRDDLNPVVNFTFIR